MSVQAKVRCISNSTPSWITDGGETDHRIVRFTPVYDGNPEHPNFEWSKWTPSGYIELTITNEKAFAAFEVGGEYLLTFEPVTTR